MEKYQKLIRGLIYYWIHAGYTREVPQKYDEKMAQDIAALIAYTLEHNISIETATIWVEKADDRQLSFL